MRPARPASEWWRLATQTAPPAGAASATARQPATTARRCEIRDAPMPIAAAIAGRHRLEVARLDALHVAQQADPGDEPRRRRRRPGVRERLLARATRRATSATAGRAIAASSAVPTSHGTGARRSRGTAAARAGRAAARPRSPTRRRDRGRCRRRRRSRSRRSPTRTATAGAPAASATRPRPSRAPTPTKPRSRRPAPSPLAGAAGQRDAARAARARDDQRLEQLHVERQAEHRARRRTAVPLRPRRPATPPPRSSSIISESIVSLWAVRIAAGRTASASAAPSPARPAEQAAHEVVQQRDRERSPASDLGQPHRHATRSRTASRSRPAATGRRGPCRPRPARPARSPRRRSCATTGSCCARPRRRTGCPQRCRTPTAAAAPPRPVISVIGAAAIAHWAARPRVRGTSLPARST